VCEMKLLPICSLSPISLTASWRLTDAAICNLPDPDPEQRVPGQRRDESNNTLRARLNSDILVFEIKTADESRSRRGGGARGNYPAKRTKSPLFSRSNADRSLLLVTLVRVRF
jgi:hypothetical protein